jgi:amidophosphoribosyltransferase
VHVRVSSPPVIGPCFYGIDLAGEEELIASARSVDDVRESIGATSLAYLSLAGLQEATQRPESALCRACLTGEYPTRIPEDRRLAKLRFERPLATSGRAKPRAPGSRPPPEGGGRPGSSTARAPCSPSRSRG